MSGRPPRKRRPPRQTCPECGKRFHGWTAGAPCPACKREVHANREPGWVPPAQYAAGNRAEPGRQVALDGETTMAAGDSLRAAALPAAPPPPGQLDLLTDAGGQGPVDGGMGDGVSWHDWFVGLSTAGGQVR